MATDSLPWRSAARRRRGRRAPVRRPTRWPSQPPAPDARGGCPPRACPTEHPPLHRPRAAARALVARLDSGLDPAEHPPSPTTTASTLVDLIASGALPKAMAVSLQRVAIGVGLGVTIGVGLALLSGLFRLGEDLVDAPMQMVRTLPWAGLIPLLIIWFGIDVPEGGSGDARRGAAPLHQRLRRYPQRGRHARRSREDAGLGRLGWIWMWSWAPSRMGW